MLGSNVIIDSLTLRTKDLGTISLTGAATVTHTDAATSTVTNSLIAGHNSSGTPANGFGTALLFQGETSTTPDRPMGRIRLFWADASDSSRASKLTLSTYNVATESDGITIDSAGQVGVGTSSPLSLFSV